ncbi:MAG: hypothetical protein LLG45_01545 [Actinomycetia bacterium]|nr:hypothetical protein [Actinomycetes bacterium]
MSRPDSPITPALLRINEAAIIGGCRRTTAFEMCRKGEWPTVETLYGRRVVTEGLLEWLRRLEEQQ